MDNHVEAALASEIEARVLEVPGVTSVLRSGSLASQVIEAGRALITPGQEPRPLVHLSQTSEGWSVEIALGVSESRHIVETVQQVDALVLAIMKMHTGELAARQLTVVHVE